MQNICPSLHFLYDPSLGKWQCPGQKKPKSGEKADAPTTENGQHRLKGKNYNQEPGTAISQVLQDLLEMDLRIPVFLSMP